MIPAMKTGSPLKPKCFVWQAARHSPSRASHRKCRPPANHIDPSDLQLFHGPQRPTAKAGRPSNVSRPPPPKAEDARSTPGPQHHGICETRIYTGEGLRGQRPSFSVLVSLCIDIYTAQPRFWEKLTSG
ncbi:hypothetical protein K456DRAFT_1494491 [Colletotrichum gloeosporioides 23]|nr:hypothetical protein K456DRAFT_1494491 [Colletotrichum gloeosporioides 23]